ncbi:hypothetical protein [Azospirillum sp. Sh1]|uniref:hypothetical protein n=1 Tax=Azospirillum sp. Sh1 TaxID=2607285 RepID=UPI0011ECDDA1|nr:hypothetical protein [Azospirillum sp. Sh1]KAA0571512.1 hypothetical protein FZ029_26430 [Azospirillum sp. Sh1]
MEQAVYGSPQPAIDVVAALTAWLALRGEVPGPLFLQADGGGTIRPDRGRLAGQAVARIVKAAAAMLPAPLVQSGSASLPQAGQEPLCGVWPT